MSVDIESKVNTVTIDQRDLDILKAYADALPFDYLKEVKDLQLGPSPTSSRGYGSLHDVAKWHENPRYMFESLELEEMRGALHSAINIVLEVAQNSSYDLKPGLKSLDDLYAIGQKIHMLVNAPSTANKAVTMGADNDSKVNTVAIDQRDFEILKAYTNALPFHYLIDVKERQLKPSPISITPTSSLSEVSRWQNDTQYMFSNTNLESMRTKLHELIPVVIEIAKGKAYELDQQHVTVQEHELYAIGKQMHMLVYGPNRLRTIS